MIRIANGAFFGGVPTARLVSAPSRQAVVPRLSQAPTMPPPSQRVKDARAMLDQAVEHLKSAEDNLSMLDYTMGPEAALQALDEGRESVSRAQQEYDRVVAEESALR